MNDILEIVNRNGPTVNLRIGSIVCHLIYATMGYILFNGDNGVTFQDNNLLALETTDLFSSIDDYDFETTLISTAVSIPGAVWLLGSGCVGLVALRRRNSR
jgi:hypothetical protein